MFKSILFASMLLPLSGAVFFIDNVVVETNRSFANVSIFYTHDKKGNAVVNVTIVTFVELAKTLVYFKMTIGEDQTSNGYKREILNVVVDIERLFKGSQANPALKSFFDSIRESMDFKIKFPMPPVSNKYFSVLESFFLITQGTYNIVNAGLKTSFLPLLQDTRGSLDLRFVGKIGRKSAMNFMGHVAFSGGYRRT